MNGDVDGDGAGSGSGSVTETAVEANEGEQDRNGDGSGNRAGTGRGTGVETRGQTQDGNFSTGAGVIREKIFLAEFQHKPAYYAEKDEPCLLCGIFGARSSSGTTATP